METLSPPPVDESKFVRQALGRTIRFEVFKRGLSGPLGRHLNYDHFLVDGGDGSVKHVTVDELYSPHLLVSGGLFKFF